MSDATSAVNSMVSSLTDSVNKAMARIQAQNQATGPVEEYEKAVNKSKLNIQSKATDIGLLSRNSTRLNVISNLAANDKVDFYKFRATSKGEMALGQLGDEGLNVQVMNRYGRVIADSNPDSSNNAAYKKLQAGELTVDAGNYTLRISREKGQPDSEAKNYALQLTMGKYTKDFDTIAKQPDPRENPFELSAATQSMLSGMNTAISNLSSFSPGQTGTQKLLGSFNLFI